MKIFLAITAILAWLFGAMLLLQPVAFYAPTGMVLTPMLATLAQAHGATLVGLGFVNWFGRNADRNGLFAVLAGNLVVQVLSLVVVVITMRLGAGMKVAPAIGIHGVLGALYLFFLTRLPRRA
jgi:hypothetical protein